MTFLWKGEVILLIWKDKRLVRMVTTIHDASITSTGKEDRRTGHQITKPTCILEYNKYMRDFPSGTVDKTPCSQCRGPGFDPWSGN